MLNNKKKVYLEDILEKILINKSFRSDFYKMSDMILLFKKYMEKSSVDIEKIEYNIKAVELFYKYELLPINKGFDNIDLYIFDEFTDKVDILDKSLGGRDGISALLSAMLLLTEFLKSEKIIKGGKIAYYRKIFKNKEYYINKYDSSKGKNDVAKDFIKEIVKNKLSYLFTRIVDDINVNSFPTLKEIVEILDNDIQIEENNILIKILENSDLIAKKGRGYMTTRKGRAFLRLEPEEKYASILYIFIYKLNWEDIFKEDVNILKSILTISSIFSEKSCIDISESNIDDNILSLCKEDVRFNLLIKDTINYDIFNIIFIGMGIVEKENIFNKKEYKVSSFGGNILKLLYKENKWLSKEKIKSIETFIKNKQIDDLEIEIIDFIKIFGGSSSLWGYLGQIYIIKKSYEKAYSVLLYAYETSRNTKQSKKILSNIIACCRKLNFNREEKIYEKKYNLI